MSYKKDEIMREPFSWPLELTAETHSWHKCGVRGLEK